MAESKSTLRWGIIGSGMISSWFIADLNIDRKDAKATHIIQAIGSSSVEKGKKFVQEHLPNASQPPTVYGSYQEAYQDPDVDIIYIGTPHGFHKKNCLDAIAHGKNILCEKAFTLNAKEAREVFEAAKAKGVFIMGAMWTRFFPLVQGVDISTSIILLYPDGKQGIITSNSKVKTPNVFCRIEGTRGYIVVDGPAAAPESFTVFIEGDAEGKKYDFEKPGRGFYWEADAVALDIAAGKVESDIMPWSETVRVMEIMDEIRRQGGSKFPQD
ncbi:hypothetical protein ACHAP8_003828 [Fusarium lateritium]